MKKRLEVRIHPDGTIEAKTSGVKGRECTDYLSLIEELLEARTIESSFTNEYYQTELVNESVTQRSIETRVGS